MHLDTGLLAVEFETGASVGILEAAPAAAIEHQQGVEIARAAFDIAEHLLESGSAAIPQTAPACVAIDTQGSVAAMAGVAENTYGRWERDEVTPSPSNMRALIRLGLIGGRQSPQGSGNGQEPRSLAAEATDRVVQTPESPGSDLQVRMQAIQNAGDREVLALFQSVPADKRKTVLKILHLVIAIYGPGR